MPHFPQVAAGLNYITYPVGPTPVGVLVTGDAVTAHVKGPYSELAASTAFVCNRTRFMLEETEATPGRQYLIDLATGAGGAETVIVGNIPAEGEGNNASLGAALFDLPLSIAASTRIAARLQSGTAGAHVLALVSLVAAGDTPGYTSTIASYGADTSTSGGALVDPGGSANTKGAYTQLTAATSALVQHMTFATTGGNNSVPVGCLHYLDIATGAGGAEVVMVPDSPVTVPSSLNINTREPKSLGYLTYIPSSTRLAVRSACNITDATDRKLEAFIIAATAPIEAVTTAETFVG